MKAVKIKELAKVMTVSLAMIGIFAVALLTVNRLTLRAATSGETYLPQEMEYVGIPDNPEEAETQTLNLAVIDTTVIGSEIFSSVDEVDPLALSPEAAAAIGAQYIYDIFGVCIDGMYVEVEFTSWLGMTRSNWRGVVASQYRNTLAQRAETERISAEFAARIEAGEDPDAVWAEAHDLFQVDYVPGYFYFTIDAITGERIDVWNQTELQAMRWLSNEESDARALIIREFIENEHDGCWETATTATLTPEEMAALYQVAERIAPKQFTNTAIASIEFSGALHYLSVDDNGNVYIGGGSVGFTITDETGRVAGVSIALDSFVVLSIHSSRNDINRDAVLGDDYGWTRAEYSDAEVDGGNADMS